MFFVILFSILLFSTPSSSYSNGLSNSSNTKATGDDREISKASSLLKFDPIIDLLYAKEGYDGMGKTSRSDNPLLMFASGLDKVLGYASRIVFVVNLFRSFLVEAPKYSIDDAMNLLNTQFDNVKNQLSVIYSKMQKKDIDAYHAVEDAVTAANIDIQLNSTLDLIPRGLRLFDQLIIFLKGLLGKNDLSADILQVTTDLLKVIPL